MKSFYHQRIAVAIPNWAGIIKTCPNSSARRTLTWPIACRLTPSSRSARYFTTSGPSFAVLLFQDLASLPFLSLWLLYPPLALILLHTGKRFVSPSRRL